MYIQNRNRFTDIGNKLSVTIVGREWEGQIRGIGLRDTHHYV